MATFPLSPLPPLLLPWFSENARSMPWRETKDPYCIWISEIMLQQTRVEAVRAYYLRFTQTLPTIQALAEVEDHTLLKLWEGLGYYNRAKNLKKAAQIIVKDLGGNFPNTYDTIISLPGIGPYTAGAVSSIAFSLPHPAVDGNVLRVCSRFLADNSCIDDPKVKEKVSADISALFSQNIHPGTFNQALMELGATVCIPVGKPHCDICPLQNHCKAKAEGSQLQFPVRKEKKPRKIEKKTVFVLQVEEEIALYQTEDSGLLGGLWALPSVSGTLKESPAISLLTDWGVDPVALNKSREEKHIFTHIQWEMTVYYISCKTKSPRFTWGLADNYPLPSAYRKLLV